MIASEGILGRDRELGIVASLVAKATAGGGALLIHGDAGIGKSALLERAVVLARAAGMRVLQTTGVRTALNYLAIESLRNWDTWLGPEFTVEYPTGSGRHVRLRDVASDLAHRLVSIWLPDADGRRPAYGSIEKFEADPEWRDLLQIHEYFHGDTGAGLGASHQTGWTGLVANLLCRGGVLDRA